MSSIERVKHNAGILIQELSNTSPACELMTAKLNEYGINMMHLAFRVHINFTPEYIKKIVHRAAKQFQNRSDTIYAIEFGEESPFSTSYFIKIRLFMQEIK